MTACSNEDEIVQTPVTASEVSTPAIKLNLDELATRGFVSEKGAWTNFKANENEVGEKYDARISLMIYSTNNSETPMTIAQTKYLTQEEAAECGDQVEFQPMRVPAGASYTAVAFVDFVGKDHADKFYKIDNLNNIEMIGEETIVNGSTDAEMRDCYNGKVTFTLTQDGTLGAAVADATGMIEDPSSSDAPEAQEIEAAENEAANVTTLQILARRHLAKVRIIMTDYNTYGEWKQYFAGEDADRAFNAEAMKVKGLATKYNALTEATVADSNKDKVFVSEYDYQLPTVNWVRPLNKNTMEPAEMSDIDMRGFSYETGATIEDDAVAYPVLSFNYFIPADETDAAVYDMEFAALAKKDGAVSAYEWTGVADAEAETVPDWQNLMVRKINSVPVVKNTLTTIWGNFLTAETPSFLVTINDVFDNEIDRVILNDDGRTYTLITIAGVKVEIIRNADGKISRVDVDKNDDKITADNWDELIAGLNNLKVWYNDSKLTIWFNKYLKSDDPILNDKISEIRLRAEDILAEPYTSTEFTNNIWIDSDVAGKQPNITVATTDGYIEVSGNGAYSDLDLTASNYVQVFDTEADNITAKSDDKTKLIDNSIHGNVDITGNAEIESNDIEGKTEVSGNAETGTNKFTGDVHVAGTLEDIASDMAGNLTVDGNATLDRTEVEGNTVLNGEDNKIYGGKYTGTVTAGNNADPDADPAVEANSVNLTIDADAGEAPVFEDQVFVTGNLLVNAGQFNDNVRVFGDATFNGGTVIPTKFIYMENAGTTLTLNAVVGNITPGMGVNTTETITVQGTEVDPSADASGTGYYSRTRLTDARFVLQ
jgi:hypothetical protein